MEFRGVPRRNFTLTLGDSMFAARVRTCFACARGWLVEFEEDHLPPEQCVFQLFAGESSCSVFQKGAARHLYFVGGTGFPVQPGCMLGYFVKMNTPSSL